MKKGNIDKESSSKGSSHGFEENIGLEGFKSEWKCAYKHDNSNKENNEDNLKNSKYGSFLHLDKILSNK